MKPMVAAAILALLAACGQGSPTHSASTAATSTPAATPTATPLPGGLEPRPGRPDLVDGEAAACIPGCGVGRVAGGALEAGQYQTEWFFGGYMTIETDGTWTRGEDSNGELGLPLTEPDGIAVYQLAFFLDPMLVLDGEIVRDVPADASAFVDWLGKHPELIVSEPMVTGIGSVPAIAVDIKLAPNAGRDADDCAPDACIAFFKVAAFDHTDGVLGDDVTRFYFADVAYSGANHLLGVKVEGRDQAHLTSILPRVQELLQTVTLPAQGRQPSAAPALVGEWERDTRCEEIVAALRAEGMEKWVLESAAAFIPGGQVADPDVPCDGAIPIRHSHYFTADGEFGSRDENGNQVDDGTYQLLDGRTFVVSKEFGSVTFHYEIDGDTIAFEPVIPDCRPECFPALWSVSVAYPGHTWTRVAAV